MSIPRDEGQAPASSSAIRRAVRRFVVVSVLALVVVGVGTVLVARSVSRDIAVRDAEARGLTFARTVCAPLVDDALRHGDATSVATFEKVMSNRLHEGSMVHMRVWSSDGAVVWADSKQLVGKRFPLESQVRRLFRSGGVHGSISQLDKPENVAYATDANELLEVYAGARSASGERIVVESYWATERLDDDAREVLVQVAPLAIGALVLFSLVVLPLSLSLARRVDHIQGENSTLLSHALAASDLERQRLARELHDGALQEVSGTGYALSVALMSLEEDQELPRRLVGEAAAMNGRLGESLRTMLLDIYPPNLEGEGLRDAVNDLAVAAAGAGTQVQFLVDGLLEESVEASRLSYRVVREGLRNVVRHAHAPHAWVTGVRLGEDIRIEVLDDGRGIDGSRTEEGHVGLQLLADTMRDVGGSFEIGPREGGGTRLAVSFPRRLIRS